MPTQWTILFPLALGALAVTQLVILFLFLSLKQEIRRLEKARQLPAQEVASREMQAAVKELQQRVGEQVQVQETPATAHSMAGMNFTRRSQVLRLHRRGESPEQIAATLGIPLNEVQLLLKVHEVSGIV